MCGQGRDTGQTASTPVKSGPPRLRSTGVVLEEVFVPIGNPDVDGDWHEFQDHARVLANGLPVGHRGLLRVELNIYDLHMGYRVPLEAASKTP